MSTGDPSPVTPSDIDALRAALAAAEAARREAEARASGAEAMVAHLKLLIAKLKHDRFGASSERSRKLIDQMELELEEIEAAASEDMTLVAVAVGSEVTGFTRRKPVRAPLPAHLPRERVVIAAPSVCPCCGGKLAKFGEDITETLEVVPRQWKVVQTVREKFTCRSCEAITQPPAPFHPIARGRAGPGLLAMILDAKFAQHLPLNRQSELAELAKAPLAVEAVRRIDAIFALERDINGASAEQRLATRTEQSAALVGELETWMRQNRLKLSRQNEVGRAMDYMLKRWQSFSRFLNDGRVCLSNNTAERALRGIAVGRKAWLFAGSDRGGERAAAIYSLIVTAKLNDVDPRAWLADVLARIGDQPTSRLDALPALELETCRERGCRMRSPTLSASEKAAITANCQAFIDTVLKPRFLPTVTPTTVQLSQLISKANGMAANTASSSVTAPALTTIATRNSMHPSSGSTGSARTASMSNGIATPDSGSESIRTSHWMPLSTPSSATDFYTLTDAHGLRRTDTHLSATAPSIVGVSSRLRMIPDLIPELILGGAIRTQKRR